uniref:Uncharacterized protein n=1 Tax=Candidatus Kentrum sp. TUN TaxID=2126343 RepID=A0A450ZCF4_9GAMM|nr:MAG: hypothetical protein BECKTUN1418E_GA0071001_100230 [Candidatus Kentron sp. TUN]VFK51463.1 MAG: hypothetical protein BECKTUN1418F_GA0071002_100228 [Candidatus Kentron sp. TUN]
MGRVKSIFSWNMVAAGISADTSTVGDRVDTAWEENPGTPGLPRPRPTIPKSRQPKARHASHLHITLRVFSYHLGT